MTDLKINIDSSPIDELDRRVTRTTEHLKEFNHELEDTVKFFDK